MSLSAEDHYEETSGVKFMSSLPRFGHSSDFANLASSDPSTQTDYLLGVGAISFFLFSLFIVWGATIVTCKCMGKRRVGICAGRALVPSNDKGEFKPPSYLWKLRGSFVTLGCCMILLCVALVGPGLQSIESTSVSIRKLNRDVRDLITQGFLIMDSVQRVRWNIEMIDVDAILAVDKACPNLDDNAFLTNKQLRRSINGLEAEFEELKEYLEQSDFETIRKHTNSILDGTDYIDSAVTTIEKNDWVVRMFSLVLTVLVFFMVLAACFARCHYRILPALKCMSELFILPLFVLAIVISWFATSILAFASVSNADFCSGNAQQSGSGPAGTVMDIFEERTMSKDDIIFTAFSYYQSGCVTEDPIRHLYKYEDDLQSGIGSATQFLEKADEIGIDDLSSQCGADVSPIIEGIGLIKDNLGILLGALRSTYELASCEKMSPVYKQAFDDTTCTDSSTSLTLVFSIMLGISVVGMLLIVLRAAMYPYKKVYSASTYDDDQDEWEEYQAYLQYMATFVNIWGHSEEDDGIATKATPSTFDTSSASSKSIDSTHSGTPKSFAQQLECTSTISSNEQHAPDEEAPLSPNRTLDASFRQAQDSFQEIVLMSPEDEERMPLSPESEYTTGSTVYPTGSTAIHSTMYTPQPKQFADGYSDDDDECKPLSPSNIKPNSGRLTKRFRTPDFLTPGRFTRWRQHNNDLNTSNLNDNELPETPLMVSPTSMQHHYNKGLNYFGDIISPLRRGEGSPSGLSGSTKID